VREHFNRESIDRAIDLLAHAARVDFHALGHGGPVAQDAQFKFMRLGIASQACTDAGLQRLAAGLLRPGDVAVIISSSAHGDELIEVAALARGRGAAVIAITASQSRLARKADLALIVDHPEDADTQLPMVSRILQLLVIDILAVGISLRRDGATASARGTHASTDAPPPGAGALLPHARLTFHGRR
jgi:glucokinase